MSLPTYDISVNESFLEFFFDSEGPKGKIRKGVIFSPANAFGSTYFNLGFGDLNEVTGELNDHSVSNNQDREKVLATVAATVLIFIEKFPDTAVYATGSTPARTRLYQMSITAYWETMSPFWKFLVL